MAKQKADPALISEGNIPRDIGKATVVPRVPSPNIINEVAKDFSGASLPPVVTRHPDHQSRER